MMRTRSGASTACFAAMLGLAPMFGGAGHFGGGHAHAGQHGGASFGASGLGAGPSFGASGLGQGGGGQLQGGSGPIDGGGGGGGGGVPVPGYVGVPIFYGYMGGYGYPGGIPGVQTPAFPAPRAEAGWAGGFGGMMLPGPSIRGGAAPRSTASQTPAARRAAEARAKGYLEVGDRSFRAGNTKRAEERYRLAIKADPASPIARVHLAQVHFVRGDYAEAAEEVRGAVTVARGDGWLINAPDVQAMFGEPADFARHVGKLESHLQAHPGDRDGWFLLGAEHYFSGRVQAAADAFARLADRKPDHSLAAFLDVARPASP